ncbi:hypothetical protein DM02DRAFT_639562 [Periconia macrospinosa]|uniref:Uncharacterized protein n=1 Tax=Periconia macrospinosa TaxID=97972 RepID=A0A2V1E757_9PLEO|nr:hypothetical protein DM02DRAFT_639562 [Periconia macrospinosa]
MAITKPHNAAFDAVGNRPRRPQPRPTKDLSWELANHVKSYLEAGEYTKGYGLLQSLLTAGASISTPAKPYVGLLAPAAHIAFASSLVVYPPITTKATAIDAIKGSDVALRYLHCIHNTIEGPAYKVVRKALSFPEERSRRRAHAYKNGGGSPSPGAGGDVERLEIKEADSLSIWHRADDFWHIVGWAFNCSVAHKNRWARWKLWLEVMLDFLESDWNTCCEEAKRRGVEKDSILQSSLIWRYISSEQPTQRPTRRRIVGAVLAMGSKSSLSHYPEIWTKETADPKPRTDDSKPTATLDFENGQLGDYASDDEDTLMLDAPRARARPRKSSVTSEECDKDTRRASDLDGVEMLGGRDSIQLRQRLIALLARVAQELPEFFTRLEDFCDTYTELLRADDMQTCVFSTLISTSRLSPMVQLALNGNFLLTYVASAPPNYFIHHPTQEHLEQELLPLRATSQSFAHNAKISLILERMFLYMIRENLVEFTSSLKEAVESGIEARQNVYGSGKGRKGNAEEEEHSKILMTATSERLLGLVEVLAIASGLEPPTRPRSQLDKSALLFSSFGSSLSSAPESETEMD